MANFHIPSFVKEGIQRYQLKPSRSADNNSEIDALRITAMVYREMMSDHLRTYAKNEWDMTHSEISLGSAMQKPELQLCVVLFKKRMNGFFRHLQKDLAKVPPEMHDAMDLRVGYNYGNDGGIAIKNAQLMRLSQDALDAAPAGIPLGYMPDDDNWEAFLKDVL